MSRAPNREKIAELMNQIPCFTEKKTLVNNMGKLFSVTRRVSMDLDDDPNISFVARLLFSTLESIVSRILLMQDYTTIERDGGNGKPLPSFVHGALNF